MNSGSSCSCYSSGRVLVKVFCLSVLNMLINVYKETHCLLQADHEGLGLMDWQ